MKPRHVASWSVAILLLLALIVLFSCLGCRAAEASHFPLSPRQKSVEARRGASGGGELTGMVA